MKNKKPTVTIGIPAFNEEANIGNLIKALLSQKQETFKLEKIIVISDMSTDQTDKIVKGFRSKNVVLVRNRKRKGKALTQNSLKRLAKSDLVVIFDADVLPKNRMLISNLVKPFIKNQKLGIVGGKVTAIKPKGFVERTLYISVQMKDYIYEHTNKGRNIYLCHGRVRAFSNELLKKFQWKASPGEDAFSYLSCISNGYEFEYAKNAQVIYRLPVKLSGHLKQSVRFLSSRKKMKEFFDEELVDKSYEIPNALKLEASIKFFLKNPLLFISYFMFFRVAKIIYFFWKADGGVWSASQTSKILVSP